MLFRSSVVVFLVTRFGSGIASKQQSIHQKSVFVKIRAKYFG